MSKKESIARYNLIIKKLKRHPASFNKIMRYLEEESSIQGYNFVVSKRTFQRDIKDISLVYNIDIAYDHSQGVYFIEEEFNSEANNRMLEAFDMFNAFNITERISQYIHFEKRKPQRTENLYGLLHAIENRYRVLFNYQKYWEDTITSRTVEPYALKEFRYRWYVMARDMEDNKIKSFALDRLSDLETSKESFSMSEDFNIEAHFQYSFGIISPNERDPHRIVLSFTPHQGKYIKSLPLHHTQRILKDDEKELQIELNLFVTHDFLMELLSMGEDVKVIQPANLKKQIQESLQNTLLQYE